MISFLEYLKEYKKNLEEDAVLAADTASMSGSEVTTHADASAQHNNTDVTSPKACIGLTDNSVLGKLSKKKLKDNGFFGKDDFHIPQNVLSGEVEKRLELPHEK